MLTPLLRTKTTAIITHAYSWEGIGGKDVHNLLYGHADVSLPKLSPHISVFNETALLCLLCQTCWI